MATNPITPDFAKLHSWPYMIDAYRGTEHEVAMYQYIAADAERMGDREAAIAALCAADGDAEDLLFLIEEANRETPWTEEDYALDYYETRRSERLEWGMF